MNAGESLSTPAQLVPPLFVRVHARTPSLHLSFPFSTPRCYVSPQGRWRTRGEPVFPRPVRTRLRANKWDETDDTAHIVLRHIPCQPGEDHALVIPCPPRVLRSPISTYLLGLQPLTPAKHPLIARRFTFSLPIPASRHHFAFSSLRLEPKFLRKMWKFSLILLNQGWYRGIFTIRNYGIQRYTTFSPMYVFSTNWNC